VNEGSGNVRGTGCEDSALNGRRQINKRMIQVVEKVSQLDSVSETIGNLFRLRPRPLPAKAAGPCIFKRHDGVPNLTLLFLVLFGEWQFAPALSLVLIIIARSEQWLNRNRS